MNNEIEEYHTCITCEHKLGVPVDPNFRKWELACTINSKFVNSSGGLTRCPYWKEEQL